MCVPHVISRPAQIFHELHRTFAEPLEAEALLVQSLGDVGVEAHAVLASKLGRVAHELRCDRERRTRRHDHAAHRAPPGVVVTPDLRLDVGEDRILVLHHAVGRQASLGFAKRHRAAAGMKSKPKLARRIHQRLEETCRAARKDVVVVARERAAAEEQPCHRGPAGGAHRFRVDARPHRVERPQPFEQSPIRHVAAGRPLVHVVVGVHEAGHGEAARLVDHLVGRRRWAGSDLDDHPVAGEQPSVLDLAVTCVKKPRPQAKRGHSTRSWGRTGTRVTGRPVAARMAARIAGPEEIVGGSPTPFRP